MEIRAISGEITPMDKGDTGVPLRTQNTWPWFWRRGRIISPTPCPIPAAVPELALSATNSCVSPFDRAYHMRYASTPMTRKLADGFVFISYVSGHPPLHVHILKNGKEISRWDIENQRPLDNL